PDVVRLVVLTVIREVTELALVTCTDVGLNVTVGGLIAPLGPDIEATLSETPPVNPPEGVTVMVEDALELPLTDSDDGLAESEKSCAATTRVAVTECIRDWLVPVIVRVNVPFVDPFVIDSVEVP